MRFLSLCSGVVKVLLGEPISKVEVNDPSSLMEFLLGLLNSAVSS